jgi:hypothetical protein
MLEKACFAMNSVKGDSSKGLVEKIRESLELLKDYLGG